MKSTLNTSGLILLILATILIQCCKKEEKPVLPQLKTTALTNISGAEAVSGGYIPSDGGAAINARGVCWNTAENPTIANSKTVDGTGTGAFVSQISGLSENVTYHVRSYATNSVGTAYGDDLSFTTLAKAQLVTLDISEVTLSSVKSGGNVSSNGGAAITARGICWSTSENPTIETSKTTDQLDNSSLFVSNISSLAGGTTYYLRAYATNSVGTAYGNQIRFTTNLLDVDGNLYHAIIIGNQVWLVENLNVIHYRNGDALPNVTIGSSWDVLTTGAYCDYNNESTNSTIYGRLYNGYAVLDNRGVCPAGWHVPSANEFQELQLNSGGPLKEIGLTHWTSPNTGATNLTGFTGLPGGSRMGHMYGSDGFDGIGTGTGFWQNEISSTISYHWTLTNYASSFINNSYTYPDTDALIFGYSIRCIKN
jgi:uncharacterized protein (TIGR02145 family)